MLTCTKDSASAAAPVFTSVSTMPQTLAAAETAAAGAAASAPALV